MQGETTTGGVSCREVLTALSDYLGAALDDETRQKAEAHLAGCANCTDFGAAFASTLRALGRLRVVAQADAVR